jgi:hypothetical protein
MIAAMIMARANRAAEQEVVAELAPGPGDDVLVAGFGAALACACWPVRPGVGLRLLAGRLTGGRIAGMPFSHVSLAGCRGIAESWPASGSWPGAPLPETGLRSHRHRQPHGPGAPGLAERHETPAPVRSNAVESRFHCLRQRAELHDQLALTGNMVLMVLM